MAQARAGYRQRGAPGLLGWGWGEDGTEWRSCITTAGALCLEPAVGDSVKAEQEARLRAGLCSWRISSRGPGGGLKIFEKGMVVEIFLLFSGLGRLVGK